MKDFWSLTEGSFNCLVDQDRNEVFRSAIRAAVKPGDVVVDLGGGSGILSLFAAEAGAARIYCIEQDPRLTRYLPTIFQGAGFGDRVTILQQDARRADLPEKVDVVICEMIATGLIEELQVPVMNRALRFAQEGARVVLERYECRADLVSSPDRFGGYRFPVVRYEYGELARTRSTTLSSTATYAEVDFTRPVKKTRVDTRIDLRAISSGTVNGVRITGLTHFFSGGRLGGTYAYSYPIVLPVPDVEVREGDRFTFHIAYRLCGGFSNLTYSLEAVT